MPLKSSKRCYLLSLFLPIMSVCVLIFDDFCGQNMGDFFFFFLIYSVLGIEDKMVSKTS